MTCPNPRRTSSTNREIGCLAVAASQLFISEPALMPASPSHSAVCSVEVGGYSTGNSIELKSRRSFRGTWTRRNCRDDRMEIGRRCTYDFGVILLITDTLGRRIV